MFFAQITQGPDYPSKGALSRFLHPPPYPVIRLLTQFTFKKNCLDPDYCHRNQVIEVHASDWSGGQRYFMISLITVVLWWGPLDAGDLEWHGLLVRSGARLKRIARAHLARLAVSTATRMATHPAHAPIQPNPARARGVYRQPTPARARGLYPACGGHRHWHPDMIRITCSQP